MAKPKLHELIAVEGELEGTVKKILEEAQTTFSKKPDHFLQLRREVRMLADTPEAKAEEITEQSDITTTVAEKLDYVRGHVVRYYDAVLQREATNQKAVADLVVDGKVLAHALPGPFLLGMETKLKALRDVYNQIPTLAPGKTWVIDGGFEKPGVYLAKDDDVRVRTKKIPKAVVLYEATKEHPAQVKELIEDVPVGQIVSRLWSGMISPAEKSDLLGRIDNLIRACKRARQRANSTEIVKVQVGRALFDYISAGTIGGAVTTVDSDDAPAVE